MNGTVLITGNTYPVKEEIKARNGSEYVKYSEREREIMSRHSREASVALNALRWTEDMAVMNPFGDVVWLRVLLDEHGHRLGLTDCCLEVEPCERHRMMIKRLAAVVKVQP